MLWVFSLSDSARVHHISAWYSKLTSGSLQRLLDWKGHVRQQAELLIPDRVTRICDDGCCSCVKDQAVYVPRVEGLGVSGPQHTSTMQVHQP